ncbi:MAG: hypothetical protein QNJ63_01090 [Calothrix sp. MO_192.B10]|nr:hypothetical protein [Calothrix sp. MO_192.B10]
MTSPNEPNRNHDYSLGKRVLSNTVLSLLDIILTKLGTVIVFILLVRLLPEQEIAAIGIGSGYLVFIAYLEIGAPRILLRDYPKVAENKHERNQLFTALILFWLLQTLFMLFICFGLHLFVLSKLNIQGISFLLLGLTIDFISLSFQDSIKTAFFSSFQQSIATKLNFLSVILRLVSYIPLIFYPSLTLYSNILIFTSFLTCIIWAFIFIRNFSFYPILCRNTFLVLIISLNTYGIWDHLNRMTIDTLFLIDTVILSWFVSIHEISGYTIALRVTSLLFVVPLQIQRGLQVAIANYIDNVKIYQAINSAIKLTFLISLLQFLFILFGGAWLLNLLFGTHISQNAVNYTIIIAFAIAIMNLSWPLISVINNLCNLRQVFFQVFLPALLLGCFIYVGAAKIWGATGVAYGNIVNYTILFLGLVIFTVKHYPFPLKFKLITTEERQLLYKFVRGQP